MALIKCSECGKEVSNKATACPNCGCPISVTCEEKTKDEDVSNLYENVFVSNKKKKEKPKKQKNECATARLVISVLMLVFSVVVLFQSCAAGLVNTVENNGNTDGSTGFMIFLVMIIFGITGIATKKTRSHITLLVLATIAALIFLYCVLVYEGIFTDIKVWGWMFGIYSLVFSFSSNAIRENKKHN